MNWLKKFAVFGLVTVSSLAIASSASAQFVVFVSGNDATTLQRVRTVSPNAFATSLDNQPITQAGLFNAETNADSLAISLQQAGLTAQKYFRPSGFIQTTPQPATPSTVFIPPTTSFAQPVQPTSTVITPTYSEAPITPVQAPVSNALLPQASQNVEFRYVAAIPAAPSNQFLLSRVRQYVPSAFFSNSGRGTYIHAGAYPNRDAAESVSRYLRSQGLDSRVLYF